MRVEVRTFAMLREATAGRVQVDLPAGGTLDDAWSALAERFPAASPYRSVVRGARNGAYAEWNTRLADGDEVAFLPPVSGGADVAGAGSPLGRGAAQISEGPIDVAGLERIVDAGHGAVVTFIGRARNRSDDGREVVELEYEVYPGMAERVLSELVAEAERRWPGCRLAVVHRTGRVPLGEAAVAIVTAAPHRGDAYEANRWAIDAIKQRLPIWKRERFADGSEWKRPGA